MDSRLQQGFQVGDCRVRPLSGQIIRPDGPCHVQPKVIDVLLCLAEHAGEVVERDTIIDQVWRRPTSEEVLTRCVSELRQAFGDERGSPQYIQTVPKRGYRLLQQVIFDQPAASETSDQTSVSTDVKNPPYPSAAMASVAVLPFDNHSRDEANLFMADAFASELRSTLARMDRLQVASRQSSVALKDSKLDVREIGQRLNVHYVISGSLLRDGNHLRVLAELDNTDDGMQIWSQTYDREVEDIFAVEQDVAASIVSSFGVQQFREEMVRARERPTSSLDAWGLVQKARSFMLEYTEQSLTQAIEPLSRAIELDPQYAAAHATLGSLLAERLLNGWTTEVTQNQEAALESIDRAVSLEPQDPIVLKMASLVWAYNGDHTRSIEALRKAVSAAPFDFGAWGYMGWPLVASGTDEDLAELNIILDRLIDMKLDHPGLAFWFYHRSAAFTCAADFEGAVTAAQEAVERMPKFSLAWIHYANVLGQLGDVESAKRAIDRCHNTNAHMSTRHFERVIKRMTADIAYLDRRLGGLSKIG